MTTAALLAGALLYAALFALAAAQPQNKALWPTANARRLRIAGWMLLAISAVTMLVRADDRAIALLGWIGLVPLAALPIVAARAYRPALARSGLWLALAAAATGMALGG